MSEKRALRRGQSSVNDVAEGRSSEGDDDKASPQRLDDDAGDRLLTALKDRLDAMLARPPVPFSAEAQKRIEEARSRARTSRFERVGYISLVGDSDLGACPGNQ